MSALDRLRDLANRLDLRKKLKEADLPFTSRGRYIDWLDVETFMEGLYAGIYKDSLEKSWERQRAREPEASKDLFRWGYIASNRSKWTTAGGVVVVVGLTAAGITVVYVCP